MSIGSTLRQLRESRQLTQAELARKVGVSTQTVSAWELDNKTPRLGKLKALAEFFEVEVATIIAGTDKNETMMTYLFGTLTEDEQRLAIDYLHYLYGQRKRDKK